MERLYTLAVISAFIGTGCYFTFHLDSTWKSILALTIFGAASTLGLIDVLARSGSYFTPPRYTHLHLGVAVGVLTASSYCVAQNQSPLVRYGGVLFAASALYQLLVVSSLTILSVRAIRRLYALFADSSSLIPYPSYVLIISSSSSSRRLKSTLFQVIVSLFRYRAANPLSTMIQLDTLITAEAETERSRLSTNASDWDVFKATLRALRRIVRPAMRIALGNRRLIAFVDLRDLRTYPADFREHVATHAVACIALMHSPMRDAVQMIDSFSAHLIENSKSTSTLDARLLRFMESVRRRVARLQSADDSLWRYAHVCPGPSLLLTRRFDPSDSSTSISRRFSGYGLVLSNEHTTGAAAHLVQILAATSLPLAQSDAALGTTLRSLPQELATKGLAPLADSYLRFRLSQSDVERFLCLLDCFEVLIKVSVIVLESSRTEEAASLAAIVKKLERPALGTWLTELERLVHAKEERPDTEIERAILGFWLKPLGAPARELIDAVNGSGLSWRGDVPRSHLRWLSWLTWVRNSTKGHGGIEESMASPVWHRFHETLLHVVSELRPLTLDATIVDDEDLALRGWLRGDVRSSPRELPGEAHSVSPGWAAVRSSAGTSSLAPFVCLRGRTCLTWNRGDIEEANYTDYSTGRLEWLRLAEVRATKTN